MWKAIIADFILPLQKEMTIKFRIWEGYLTTILAPGGRI